MNYYVDVSIDGTEWNEMLSTSDLEIAVRFARKRYGAGGKGFVNVWDWTERLVWRDGQFATPYYDRPFTLPCHVCSLGVDLDMTGTSGMAMPVGLAGRII